MIFVKAQLCGSVDSARSHEWLRMFRIHGTQARAHLHDDIMGCPLSLAAAIVQASQGQFVLTSLIYSPVFKHGDRRVDPEYTMALISLGEEKTWIQAGA